MTRFADRTRAFPHSRSPVFPSQAGIAITPMNFRQLVEGVHGTLLAFPELLDASECASRTRVSSVRAVLDAVGLPIPHAVASDVGSGPVATHDVHAAGLSGQRLLGNKRKSPTVGAEGGHAAHRAQGPALAEGPSPRATKFKAEPSALLAKSSGDATDRQAVSSSYPELLCEYLAGLLLGSYTQPRPYQQRLTVAMCTTFRQMLPLLLSGYAHVAFAPAFAQPAPDEAGTAAVSKAGARLVLTESLALSLLSTAETLAAVVRFDERCIELAHAMLAHMPLPLPAVAAAIVRGEIAAPPSAASAPASPLVPALARTVYALTAMAPNSPAFLASLWDWQSLLQLLPSVQINLADEERDPADDDGSAVAISAASLIDVQAAGSSVAALVPATASAGSAASSMDDGDVATSPGVQQRRRATRARVAWQLATAISLLAGLSEQDRCAFVANALGGGTSVIGTGVRAATLSLEDAQTLSTSLAHAHTNLVGASAWAAMIDAESAAMGRELAPSSAAASAAAEAASPAEQSAAARLVSWQGAAADGFVRTFYPARVLRATPPASASVSSSSPAAATAAGSASGSSSAAGGRGSGGEGQAFHHMITVGGVPVPIHRTPSSSLSSSSSQGGAEGEGSASPFVYVDGAESAVTSLAMALNETRPILLEGSAGSGKSRLVDHLARLTGNTDYLRLYMDDQMDSKALLGTQTCTDVPGSFSTPFVRLLPAFLFPRFPNPRVALRA